jgi:glucokinase
MKEIRFQKLTTIAQTEMRAINRSAVLEYLRLAKTASRTELSTQLKISKPTVMRIIDELVADGWVLNLDEKEKGARRSRDLLALNAKNNLVIGVDLGGSHISGIVANIGGEILFQDRVPEEWETSEMNFSILVQFIREFIEKAAGMDGRILGIAVGVPGIVDSKVGMVKIAPSLNWDQMPLLEMLENEFKMPITIENDVNLAVLGENWFGVGVGVDNMVMISIGTGIGSGIILDGKLYRGFRDSSGEIGYYLPGVSYLDRKYPKFGALESQASCKGIAEKALHVLKQRGEAFDPASIDSAMVFKEAKSGTPWAQEIINETVDFLSLAIANVSVSFDPELIILGGGIIGSADQLIEPIQNRLKEVIPYIPRIEASTLRSTAPLLGCVVRVFQKCVDYTVAQVV